MIGPMNTPVIHAENNINADEILSQLPEAQKQALKTLESTEQTGLHLSPNVNLETNSEVPVIVEFKERPAKAAVVEAKAHGISLTETEAKEKVETNHKKFKSDIQELTSAKITRTYRYSFNGVAMKLPANQVKKLLTSSAVKAVFSNEEVRSEPVIPQEEVQGGGSGIGLSLSYQGVDKLHQEGITGKGVKVGIIDTGVDYHHPDIKGAYRGGYDFVNNDDDPMETTYEDWKKSGAPEFDVLTGVPYNTFHGTHVAGIIAGQGKNESEYKMIGVAPDVDLYAYKVLGPYGHGTTDAVLAGIDKAVEEGMDIINLSLGAGINNPLYPTSIAINQAVLDGVTAVVSAGNSGNSMYTLGSPGTAALALTVGASDAPSQLLTFKGVLQFGTETIAAELQQMANGYADHIEQLNEKTFSIIDVGLGDSTGYKNKDVKDKIVLVSRGTTTINDKITLAKQKGAAAILIYNSNPEEGQIPAFLGEGLDFIPTFSLTNAQGLALKNKITSESTFTFNELTKIQTEGDTLADFSSRGPTRITYDIKPEVVAPGVSVFSTVPSYVINKENPNDYQYAYQRLSGTSMAAPYTTGVAALMLQAKPDLEPSDIKSILMNTANPLKKDYSVLEVGAGRINAYQAVHSSVEIEVLDETPMVKNGKVKSIKNKTGELSFGSVDLREDVNEKRTLNLSNTSNETKIFDVKVQFQTGERGALDANKNGVKLSVESTTKLKGNKQTKTNASLFIPKTAEKGIYEGHIVYTNQEHPDETYQVPFVVHAVEEGIGMFNTLSLGMSSDRYRGSLSSATSSIEAQLQLNSNMKNIDFTLIDGKTNQDLGYLGSLNGLQLSEGVQYSITAFNGTYYPFDNRSPIGISTNPVLAKQGYYKIKMIATSDTGKQFTEVREFVVDNGKPSYKFAVPDVIEFEDGQKTVTISGSVYDPDIEVFKAAGMNIDQSANKIITMVGGQGNIPVNKDGTFKYDMPIGSTNRYIKLYAVDPAGNGAFGAPKVIKIIKKGTPYYEATFDHESAKPGDTVKVKLVLNNAADFQKNSLTFSFYKDYFELVNIELLPEAQQLGGLKLTKSVVDQGSTIVNNLTIETAEGNTQTLNGQIPLAEVTLKVKDYPFDIKSDGSTIYTRSTSNYQNRSGKTIYPVYNEPYIEFVPTYSKVRSLLYAQGLLNSAGAFDTTREYSKIGADVYIEDTEGNTINQILNKYGSIQALHLPLTDQPLRLYVKVPGHFKTIYNFEIGMKSSTGELIGQFANLSVPTSLGGDVNGDDVIDIMDALYIQTYWGTNKRDADINFDGTVDGKDLAFVAKNYLLQNPTIDSPPIPKKQFKGKTLDVIKSELGIK
ncbi:S8 family serine peptidase [Gottfriedia sp. NPDC056225]|uniref:S8 family serine peptidase n=1 Tax=Gottfriedia sp. NPDC056225 TaxID=3345751 RepID=UPI0035E0CE51